MSADLLVNMATADTPLGQHARVLLCELDDIHADRAMATQMRPETTRAWLVELADEERRVWHDLSGVLGSHQVPAPVGW